MLQAHSTLESKATATATRANHLPRHSYGGHYAPVYNEYIMQQNMAIDAGELPGAHKIDLRAVLIGNGWYDPLLNYAGYYNYTTQNSYDVRFKHDWQRAEQYNAMFGEGNCEYLERWSRTLDRSSH